MASIERHLNLVKGQLECIEEHGHLTEPNEFWALSEAENAIARLEKTFKENGRNLND